MPQVHVDSELTPIRLPRASVRFPIRLKTPRGFRIASPASWPTIDGRLEFVEGTLLFWPACVDFQQDVSAEAVRLLGNWSVLHPEFIVAGNEAGMLFDGEARGADAAVWSALTWDRIEGGSVGFLRFWRSRLRVRTKTKRRSSPRRGGT